MPNFGDRYRENSAKMEQQEMVPPRRSPERKGPREEGWRLLGRVGIWAGVVLFLLVVPIVVLSLVMRSLNCCFGPTALAATPTVLMERLGVTPPLKEEPVPDIALKDLPGRTVTLKEYRGKVLLVNFWATWCVPCQWEMPEMEKLYQAFKKEGFVVVAISVDRQGGSVVKPFVEERKLTYPILLDTRIEAARQFGVAGLPATFLVGADGKIKGIIYGPREWNGEPARALVRELLAAARGGKG